MSMFEPDRDQLEIFVEAIFRHAGGKGWVSFRSFFENNNAKPFRLSPTSLEGGFKFVVDVAEMTPGARPITLKKSSFVHRLPCSATRIARERKTSRSASRSRLECDQRPQEARVRLERILGLATIVVRSGGSWTDSGRRDTAKASSALAIV